MVALRGGLGVLGIAGVRDGTRAIAKIRTKPDIRARATLRLKLVLRVGLG